MLDAAEMYDLFARRDPDAAPGIILAVTSTGIFCQAGCPARLPKFENCRFFASPAEAQAAGFRACKRCHPLGRSDDDVVDGLVAELECRDEPLRETDLRARGLTPSTVRRAFQRRFGQSFAQYQRERRLAASVAAPSVLEAQLDAGYQSASGFREAYAKAYGTSPGGGVEDPLYIDWVGTPLGQMVLLADDQALHLCEFTDRKALPRQMGRIRRLADRPVVMGRTSITDRAEKELSDYFAGKRTDFDVPIALNGTAFQSRVWEGLRAIPYGRTATYGELAETIGSPRAVRAAASSNAANALAIIVPCHRIVPKAGGVGGYAGGAVRKQWLLDHEARHI